MKNYTRVLGLLIISAVVFGFANFAQAVAPTLSLSVKSNGDAVTITVNGDADKSVLLSYNKTNVGPQLVILGNTNPSGFFSTDISSSSYGIASGAPVRVVLGGVNGSASPDVAWPTVSSSSASASISLSQTGVVLQVGGSSTIQVTNNTGTLYLLNNTNSSIANISLGSSNINISANTAGSTVATVCVVGSTSNCASIYVTVQSTSATALSFSLNNLTVAYNSSVPVTISGGTGTYFVLNNSNSNIVQTSLSNSTITLTANSTSGSSSITVCSTNMTSCGIINVTAAAASSSTLSFSVSSPTISTGETKNITVSGASGGTYYISSNSNTSVVTSTISDSTITLYGVTNGYSTINVCSSLGYCGYLTVTVEYHSTGGKLTLSQTSLTILTNQSISVTISGGETPYNVTSEASSVVTATLSGNVITLYGANSGSTFVDVCSAGGGCTLLPVTVSAASSASQVYFSQNNVSLKVGNSTTVSIFGTGNYYIYSNSNPSAVTASINGNSILLNAVSVGSSNINICQGSSSQCAILYAGAVSATEAVSLTLSSTSQTVTVGNTATITSSVSGFTSPSYYASDSFSGTTSITNSNINSSGFFSWTPSTNDIGVHSITIRATDSYGHSSGAAAQITVQSASSSTTTTTTNVPEAFTRYLGYGDTGSDVLALQKLLVNQGYLAATPTGHYGPATIAAIKKLQIANNLSSVGIVGPATKTLLNKLSSAASSAIASTLNTTVVQQIQAKIAELQAQLLKMIASQ